MPSEDRDEAEERPITAAQIRQRAYDLWERNHRPEGFEMQFWLLAERELRAERARRARLGRTTQETKDDPTDDPVPAAPDRTDDRAG